MAVSIATFRIRFPEFSDNSEFPDPRIQLFLDDVVLLHIGSDELRWNGKYDIAQAYLAAHLLSKGTGSEAGDSTSKSGSVSSTSAGGVSVSRDTVTKDRSEGDGFYMSTSYGQQFIVIRNTTFVGVLVANSL